MFGIALALGAAVAETNYLIMSLPALRQVAYAKLPSDVLRILVPPTDGLVTPTGICLDAKNHRLFVTDASTMRIVWYQLLLLTDGKLITDGRNHVAVANVVSSWCTVDGVGNLFFTGKVINPLAPSPADAVYKCDSISIATGATNSPVLVWSTTNSGVTPCVVAPSGVQTDDFTLFWGNKQRGIENGVICRGAASPPQVNPVAINVANNEDNSRGLTLTSRFLFYAAQHGIFGMVKGKTYRGCSNKDDCVKVSGDVVNPQGMAWDRDGTVYVADSGRPSKNGTVGAILSFPAGSLASHVLTEVIDAPEVHDIIILQADAGNRAAVSVAYTACFDVFAWFGVIALLALA